MSTGPDGGDARNADPTNDSAQRRLSDAVLEELQSAELGIRAPAVAERVWERLFSPREREQLANEFDLPGLRNLGALGMWQAVRGGGREQAIIDIAEGVSLLDAQTASWLRRELNFPEPAERAPVWDVERGVLSMGTRVIRRVRILQENIEYPTDSGCIPGRWMAQ